jgi:hypothetical protein
LKLTAADILILNRLGVKMVQGEEVASWEMLDGDQVYEGYTLSDPAWPTEIAGVSIFKLKK